MAVQYTIRGIPRDIDDALRDEARATGRSLNAVVLGALTAAMSPGSGPHGDLDWFIGERDATVPEEALAWLDRAPADLDG